jgi:hypothetical protein
MSPVTLTVAPPEELEEAREAMMAAVLRYTALLPKDRPSASPLEIEPKILHASPDSFRRGYNMMLDSGGYMPGKIPVAVIPARPKDLRKYARKHTVKTLLQALKLDQP